MAKTKPAASPESAKPAAGGPAGGVEKKKASGGPAQPEKAKRDSAKSEIDEIFAAKPKGKAAGGGGSTAAGGGGGSGAAAADGGGADAGALAELAQQVKAAREKAKKPKVEGSKDDIFGAAAGKGRKKTEEGFAIYTEDELGFGKKGGDTDLCPFDCDCCF